MLLPNRLAFLMLALALPASAQTQPAGQQQEPAQQPVQQQLVEESQTGAETDQSPVSQERTPVPLPVSITGPSLAFTSEQRRTNILSGGLTIGTTYDDNALNTSSDRVGSFGYSILPNIVWDQSTTRLRWTFDYAAGLSINQNVSDRNQNSQNLGANFQYRLSPHVTLGLQDRFAISTGFFNQVQGDPNAPGPGVQQPNDTIITPLATETSNVAAAILDYQFGAGSMIGGSTTFYNSQYSNVSTGVDTLQDTQTYGAQGFYTHRITPKNWIGVAYRYQHFGFDPSGDRTNTQSIVYFQTIHLRPNLQLSFFAGPEYSAQDGYLVTTVVELPTVYLISVPTSQNRWTGSGGANLGWQGEYTSAVVGFTRQVSDGGGLLTTVLLTNVNGTIRRQLTRSWILEFFARYSDNDPLSGASATTPSIKGATGSVGFSRTIGKNLGVNFGYARDYQQQYEGAGVPLASPTDHNRGWVSLSYNVSRPIGR